MPVPRSGRPTSRDVAEAAGVSQSTVSIVLTGKWPGRVSPATAQAVRAAAERLDYRPNLAARNLRLGRTRTVLLVVPTLDSPFFGPVYSGAAQVAAEHGFGVVVYPWPDGVGPAPGPFGAPHAAIDGILASSMAAAGLDDLRDRPTPMPLVMLDSDPAQGPPTVNFAVDDGMRQIVEHLAALGHRRFGHLAASIGTWTFQARALALDEAVGGVPGARLARAGTPLSVSTARAAAWSLLRGPAGEEDTDAGTAPPTALICDDDMIAAGAYKAARALGLDVPRDVSITGFDDLALARALEPELTTVRLPARELGALGMTALLELLDGRRPPDRSLRGRLVVRASTSAAPRSEPDLGRREASG